MANKAFNLVDAAVNFGIDELEVQISRWLAGSIRRMALPAHSPTRSTWTASTPKT